MLFKGCTSSTGKVWGLWSISSAYRLQTCKVNGHLTQCHLHCSGCALMLLKTWHSHLYYKSVALPVCEKCVCVCNICQPERAAKDVSIDQSSGQPGFGNYRIIIFLVFGGCGSKDGAGHQPSRRSVIRSLAFPGCTTNCQYTECQNSLGCVCVCVCDKKEVYAMNKKTWMWWRVVSKTRKVLKFM